VRWRPWPRTEEEWWAQANELARETRQAIIEVATEVGATDLAARAKANDEERFPSSEFLQELEARHRGASLRVVKRARKRFSKR